MSSIQDYMSVQQTEQSTYLRLLNSESVIDTMSCEDNKKHILLLLNATAPVCIANI